MCKTWSGTGTHNLDISGWTSVQYACRQIHLKVDEDKLCARLDQIQGGHIIYDISGWTSVQYACKQAFLKVDKDRICARLGQIQGGHIF